MRIRDFLSGFEAYAWEESSRSIAERYGLAEEDIIRFDLNTSPYKPVETLREVELEEIDIHQYPDTSYSSLREKLTSYTGFSIDSFVITNGADEALDIIAKVFIESGDEAVISTPTYSYFRIVTEVMGGKPKYVMRRKDGFSDDIEAILEGVNKRTKVIFLCSPNNPTGNLTPERDVEKLLSETDAAVVVDEAYYEFCGRTVADLTRRYGNLIVVRTFSKAFAMAGARVGYIIAAEETVRWLNKVRPPNSLSIPSLKLAEKALEHVDAVKRNVRLLMEEKEFMNRELSALEGVRVFPSEANFLLVKFLETPADEVHAKLMQRGLILRNLSSVPGLENCLRITIHKPENNRKLLASLRHALRGM